MSGTLVAIQNIKEESIFTALQCIDKRKFHVNFWHFSISTEDFYHIKLIPAFHLPSCFFSSPSQTTLKKMMAEIWYKRQFRVWNIVFKIMFSVLLIRFWISWGQGLSEYLHWVIRGKSAIHLNPSLSSLDSNT